MCSGSMRERAAAAFILDYFGMELAAEDLRPLDGEEARAAADLRLREIVTGVCTGQDVDAMELLECLGRVGEDNWASLGLMEPVGLEGDWWPALLKALKSAAIGEDQQARDRALMAFCLTIRDGPSAHYKSVASLVQEQREADSEAFAAALAEFTSEEQAYLKTAIGE